jgi:hypothetical protein
MPGKQHISSNSGAPSPRDEGRKAAAQRSGALEFDRRAGKAATSTGEFPGADCQTCSRFEHELEPFVGPEVVSEYLDIDAETVVRFARLGYLPAHSLHIAGKRTHWRFLLSEVHAVVLSRTNTYGTPHHGQRT